MDRRTVAKAMLVLPLSLGLRRGHAQKMPTVVESTGHANLAERWWEDEKGFTWRIIEIPSLIPLSREFVFESIAYAQKLPRFPDDYRFFYQRVSVDATLGNTDLWHVLEGQLHQFEKAQSESQGTLVKEIG